MAANNRKRMGVRGRLLIAFLSIAAFVVLASVAALYSFLVVGGILDRITQRRMPSALNTLEIARQVEQIVAAAPAFLSVTTHDQRQGLLREIRSKIDGLNALVDELDSDDVGSSILLEIESVVKQLVDNLDALNRVVANRITFHDRKQHLISQLSKTSAGAHRALSPGIRVMDAKFSQLQRVVANLSIPQEERSRAIEELAKAISSLHPLQKTQAEVSSIADTLLNAASADSLADLNLVEFPLRKSLESLSLSSEALDQRLKNLLDARIEEFRDLIGGTNSLLEARSIELTLIANGEALLSENNELSRRLTQAAGRLVTNTKADIARAGFEARSAQSVSTATLAGIVVLSLVSSTLIVWLYVGRNLLVRLTSLKASMSAIAHGDLDATIPQGGSDEISEMAEALVVFRNTALEVKKSNLQEINDARRRLTDAIESITDGFSLFDAEDRLVLCNSMYRRLLYPGREKMVASGTSFESIIRKSAEGGLIRDAAGRVEEWIEDRLAQHNEPGQPHVQRRDDRWIMVSERKTDDGGTVATYTDITELKQHEVELDEKSKALEVLSTQLAKYLSPQVYASIFSGRQEVKIASNRKKLTVFFSDIADFTETADRLESEELTQLLNHYLTEMSRIALDYGATIDKYIGDAILIFFGDPESRGAKEDALACVKMAIAMRAKMRDLQAHWRDSGFNKPLKARVGIHTGYCTVGNFGSDDRMDYTIIGGTVNIASRLESASIPGETLISYETYALVSDQVHCEEQGEIDVKGVAYPIATYKVIDLVENLDNEDQALDQVLPHLKLDIDADNMSREEKKEAAAALRRAANRLACH